MCSPSVPSSGGPPSEAHQGPSERQDWRREIHQRPYICDMKKGPGFSPSASLAKSFLFYMPSLGSRFPAHLPVFGQTIPQQLLRSFHMAQSFVMHAAQARKLCDMRSGQTFAGFGRSFSVNTSSFLTSLIVFHQFARPAPEPDQGRRVLNIQLSRLFLLFGRSAKENRCAWRSPFSRANLIR